MRIPVERLAMELELETLWDGGQSGIEFATADLNRPGLALTGFFGYFAEERMQVLGRHEMTYLETLDAVRRYEAMDALLKRPLPCLVVTRGMEPPLGLTQLAVKHARPVFRSQETTSRFIHHASQYLGLALAPAESRPGVLVDVYGVGVLITGESGTGKSETALELLRRGHRLVADDLVDIRRVGNALSGSAPGNLRYFMEIRGIGIINIRHLYGIGSVLVQKDIDMVCHLEPWDNSKQYERLGLTENTQDILGVSLPALTIPVIPGRNLAILVEVAARNRRLKHLGYNAAADLQCGINEGSYGQGDA